MFSYINQSIDTGAIAILHAALLLASYTKWQILPNAGDPPVFPYAPMRSTINALIHSNCLFLPLPIY